jgi:hypothetical protein
VYMYLRDQVGSQSHAYDDEASPGDHIETIHIRLHLRLHSHYDYYHTL